MANYRYRAKKGPTEIVDGVVNAVSRESAIDIINSLGYMPVQVELESSNKVIPPPKIDAGRSRKVSLRDIVLFSAQLSRLIKTGVPILKSLDIIAEQTNNNYLRSLIVKMSDRIRSGGTFSGALLDFPEVFSPLYVSVIRAGEDGGTLPVALERIGDYLRKQDDFISRIKLALIYPAFMLIVGGLTVLFMLIFVIPKIQSIYTGAGQNLPLVTKILISVSDGILHNWGAIVIFIASGIFIFRRLCRFKRELVSGLKLKIPFYGKLVLKSELARLSASMELSLKNGIQLIRAIELALPVLDNDVIKNEMKRIFEQIKQGESFGRNLKRSKIFPVFMSNLVIIGEESGRLDEMLGEVANYFQRDTDDTLKVFTTQFEPMVILIIGLVLGYIVIAMLLPIFELNLVVS